MNTPSRRGAITRYEHLDLIERIDRIDERLHEIERKVWYMTGSSAVAAAAFTILAGVIIYHITHGGG